MRYNVLAAVSVLLFPAFIYAKTGPLIPSQQKMETKTPTFDALQIQITINPEGRVSVTRGGALPPPASCGVPIDLTVMIVNQGFITDQLEAELVDAPTGVTLNFHPRALKGVPEELRQLHITLMKPGPTDVTISFRAHNDVPDLGGRDRIHFLMRCR